MTRAAAADALIGSVIGDRYEVVRRIAKGGMGTIYEVRNIGLGRSFALKTLDAEAAEDFEVLVRFRREAEIVAKLRHPHIVEVVDWDNLDDGIPYLVMEYLSGEPLAARVRRGPLAWPQLALIADQILAALAVAHNSGVVHRDLKPENVFLAIDDGGEERVKLLDFGISKLRDSKTFATTDARLLGTPAYMAPEQAEGRTDLTGPCTDVWAIGAILHEMATGRVAFDAPNTPAILYRVCHGEPASLESLRPDAPPAFAALVTRTLAKDIAKRPADVERVRSELRASLQGVEGVRWPEVLHTRPDIEIDGAAVTLDGPRPVAVTAMPTRTVVDKRRTRWPFVIVGLAALAVAAVLVVPYLFADDGAPEAAIATTVPAPSPGPSPAPKPTPPSPPQETVELRVRSEPPGAVVYRDGDPAPLGTTPFAAKLARSSETAKLVLKLSRFKDYPLDVSLDGNGSYQVALVAEKQNRPPKPPVRTQTQTPSSSKSDTYAPDWMKKPK